MSGLVQQAKIALARHGWAARKKLGQNFMVDEETLASIADALAAGPEDTVLEIGPGLGFLTRHLVDRAGRLITVEIDEGYCRFLRDQFGSRLEVIPGDVLKTRLADVATGPVKVIGNIPYNITSPLLEWLIAQRKQVPVAVITMQKEVAERLTADPGKKTWGALSVFVRLYCDVRILKIVHRGAFYPPPDVDSAVVLLTMLGAPRVDVADEAFFFTLVRRAFQKRRKTLPNALQSEPQWPKKAVEKALGEAAIDPGRRAETLTLKEWARLTQLLDCPTGEML